MNKVYNFPLTTNASDVIRRNREIAIYNPCNLCTLEKAILNNNILNNQLPSENQTLQYKNGTVQWTTISITPQVISSTTGDVSSSVSTSLLYGTVFITPDAGNTPNRTFTLPSSPLVGFTLNIKNCSYVPWNVVTSETNGKIYSSGTGTTYGVIVGIDNHIHFKYLGIININNTNTPVWIT